MQRHLPAADGDGCCEWDVTCWRGLRQHESVGGSVFTDMSPLRGEDVRQTPDNGYMQRHLPAADGDGHGEWDVACWRGLRQHEKMGGVVLPTCHPFGVRMSGKLRTTDYEWDVACWRGLRQHESVGGSVFTDMSPLRDEGERKIKLVNQHHPGQPKAGVKYG